MRKKGIIFRASTYHYGRYGIYLDLLHSSQKYIFQKQSLLLLPLVLLFTSILSLSPLILASEASQPIEKTHAVTQSTSNTITPSPVEITPTPSLSHLQPQYFDNIPSEPVQQKTTLASYTDTPQISPSFITPPEQNLSITFSMPLPFYTSISTYYSYSHPGIDLTAPLGTPVSATGAGTVIEAGWSNQGYGNTVVIDRGNSFTTRYAHLSSLSVTQGQSVAQGSIIGAVGCTGWCTGSHLHFEIRQGGRSINPISYLAL